MQLCRDIRVRSGSESTSKLTVATAEPDQNRMTGRMEMTSQNTAIRMTQLRRTQLRYEAGCDNDARRGA